MKKPPEAQGVIDYQPGDHRLEYDAIALLLKVGQRSRTVGKVFTDKYYGRIFYKRGPWKRVYSFKESALSVDHLALWVATQHMAAKAVVIETTDQGSFWMSADEGFDISNLGERDQARFKKFQRIKALHRVPWTPNSIDCDKFRDNMRRGRMLF